MHSTLRHGILSRAGSGAVLLATCALLLTACSTPSGQTTDTPGGHATSTAKASSGPDAETTPTPTATPITLTCDQLLTQTQLSAMVPVIVPQSGFSPDQGSAAEQAVSFSGVACGYTNPNTHHTVAVAVARPADPDLTDLKNKAITDSNVVPTYGVPPKVMGYFRVDGSTGVAEAFTGGYWIVAESADYIEPGDAGQVIAAVLSNLQS